MDSESDWMHEAIGAENYIDFCEFFLSLWAKKKVLLFWEKDLIAGEKN